MGRRINAAMAGTLAGFVVGSGLGVAGRVLHANVQAAPRAGTVLCVSVFTAHDSVRNIR